ncbi:hypothetical protein N7468_005588 [Penicillium chermesinum]|uniref:Uncharacterized protein n=1 Tax=Penicillium chermesinum TaxID=63820 RepID=A0A9W9P1X4_9EURO|nr:uncharacterized protein N7468_005588 [Penicillium chermesinum]KAJ5232632.1 hypothetical protein N7468_005588 [Penicillium chermesinum]
MILSRRAVLFVGLAFISLLLITARQLSQSWSGDIRQVVGLGEFTYSLGANRSHSFNVTGHGSKTLYAPQPNFTPGIPKPPGEKYTKTLVIPRTSQEDVSWIADELPDWDTAIYVADDSSAPLHPPKNKGHEVMIYLTYVIDFYDQLPDVAVFMHSHQNAWHNDELFDGDAAEILRRLSMPRVVREGYMNTRCQMGPGCPDWMHPGAVVQDEAKQEEVMFARAWGELFPTSRSHRIRTIPRSRFIFYRDWLLHTDLSDYIAGRIWEYLWQYVFTGEPVVCVPENVCLCDGYGVCFGGPEEFQQYKDLVDERNYLQQELSDWAFLAEDIQEAEDNHQLDETMDLKIPPPARQGRRQTMYSKKSRALEANRPWKEGDGF